MKVSKRGQVNIDSTANHQARHASDEPREELTARSRKMMQIMEERKKAGLTGVDVVAGILGKNALGEGVSVDDYIEEIRRR